MTTHHLTRYITRHRDVPGWLDDHSAGVIARISMRQRHRGVTGGLGEIGVFQGRLFILLKLTAHANERCFAADTFPNDLHDRFLANVERWTGDADVTVLRGSSTNLTPEAIRDHVGGCRIVSIDGGHDEDVVLSDIRLVERILVPEGVAVLDDVFNERFPGVAAATARYLLDPASALKPFAVSPGKLYLARPEHVDRYRAEVTEGHPTLFEKTEAMFDSPVAVLVRPPALTVRSLVGRRLRRTRLRTPVGWAHRQVRRAGAWTASQL
ncbi:MAG: class I SAM-dependent methyltransferase [Dehalococcoidia bacterium]